MPFTKIKTNVLKLKYIMQYKQNIVIKYFVQTYKIVQGYAIHLFLLIADLKTCQTKAYVPIKMQGSTHYA